MPLMRKPGFLWQGLLIVQKIVALASVGVVSLRQDKLLAQREAAERAQAIADDLLPKLWSELTTVPEPPGLTPHTFQVDDAGQLFFPPPVSPIPVPKPFSLADLNAEQARWCRLARQAEQTDPDAAARAYQDFLDSSPPEDFAAAAYFALGLLFGQQGDSPAAAQTYRVVLEKYPAASGESGLPLAPLAQFKLIELAALTTNNVAQDPLVSPMAFCSNILNHPTPLTPYFLSPGSEAANVSSLSHHDLMAATLREWEIEEQSRRLFSAASKQFDLSRFPPAGVGVEKIVAPRLFWFTTPPTWRRSGSHGTRPGADAEMENPNWLAARFDWLTTSNGSYIGTNHCFVCRHESEVGNFLTAVVKAAKPIPDYFGIGVEVAGKQPAFFDTDLRLWHYFHYGGKGGGIRKEYLSPLAT
ncbi:MAG: hypothetical protein DME25_11465, partial [Verrucomicrobia bacterium]